VTEADGISSQNISSILNGVQPRNDLSQNGKGLLSTSSFSAGSGYIDFSAILSAPSYDPLSHALTLTRSFDTSSDEMEPEEDDKLIGSETQNNLKKSLQKYNVISQDCQEKAEVGDGVTDRPLFNNDIDKISDFGSIFGKF
jgi:hypothetical protein